MSNSEFSRYPEIRYTNFFETTKRKTEEEKIHTSDLNILMGLSYAVSTSTEIESSTVHSKEECIRRLLNIENEIRSGRLDGYEKEILPIVPYETLSTTMFSQFHDLGFLEVQQQHASVTTARSVFVESKGKTTMNKKVSNKLKPDERAVNLELSSTLPKLPQRLIDNMRLTLGFESSHFKNAVELNEGRLPLPKRLKKSHPQGKPIPQLGRPYQRKVIPIPTSSKNDSTVYEMFVKLQRIKAKQSNENQDNSTSELINSEIKEVSDEKQTHFKNDFVRDSGKSGFEFPWFKSIK